MKLKTNSSAKKRIRFTGTGKVRVRKSAVKHLLAQKSKRQKKLHRGGKPTTLANAKNMNILIPYGK